MSEARPTLWVDVEVAWCSRHLLPFKRRWPAGYAGATAKLVSFAMKAPVVKDSGATTIPQLEAVLWANLPLCCLVTDDELLECYRSVGIEP